MREPILIRATGALAAVMLLGGSLGAEDRPTEQKGDRYLQKFVAASEYNSSHAEWNKKWYGLTHDTKMVEEVFRQHKAEILAPLVPRLRTFDGGEYPRVRVVAMGEPVRSDSHFIGYHLTIYGTLEPRESPPGKGGLRPLVDTCYLAWVKWDPEKSAVAQTILHTGQVRALPKKALEAALAIVAKADPRYTRNRLDDMHSGWYPAWYLDQVLFTDKPDRNSPEYLRKAVPVDTDHNIVELRFLVPEQGGERETMPCHIVGIDLEEKRVLGVGVTSIYTGEVIGNR